MEFAEKIGKLSSRIDGLKDKLATEEATKTSIVMPFISALGYDVFCPDEIIPEFIDAFPDIGIEKRYPKEFLDQCVIVDETVEVGEHWIYDKETGIFSEPVIEVAENIDKGEVDI